MSMSDGVYDIWDTVTGKTAPARPKAGNWIQGAVKRPGQLHRDLNVPAGQPIPTGKLQGALQNPNAKIRQRARFAETMKGLR